MGGPLGCLWASPEDLSPEAATDGIDKGYGEALAYSRAPRAQDTIFSCSHRLYRCVSGGDCKAPTLVLLPLSPPPEGRSNWALAGCLGENRGGRHAGWGQNCLILPWSCFKVPSSLGPGPLQEAESGQRWREDASPGN